MCLALLNRYPIFRSVLAARVTSGPAGVLAAGPRDHQASLMALVVQGPQVDAPSMPISWN